jgi:pimeloyl-ACP methyl ester carboxylesterase
MPWESPAPVPPPGSARLVASSGGVTVALHDLGGQGVPVLFCHPTGFLGMTWAPMAAQLTDVAHAWALDFRGHGDSTSPASMDFDWAGMADDVLAVVDELGVPAGTLVGAGHSMGGTALLTAELRRPGTFARLWMYEPIVSPWRATEGPRVNFMAEAARRRRPWFPDREAAYDNFSAKPPLDSLDPAALAAYVAYGLRDQPDGDAVELKCLPEVEARVFEGGFGQDTFDHLDQIGCPATIAIGADGPGPASFGPAVVEALPHGRLDRYPHLSHFGPMEDPAAMAAALRADMAA